MPRPPADEVINLQLAEDGFSGRRFFSLSILARVQDGAGDRELRVLRDFFAIKTPTNRLQAG